MTDLKTKTLVMSGGSRGIGLAIALRAAADGANIVLIAKTDAPHRTLPGTVHSAAAEIEKAGGNALPIVGDVRDDDCVTRAIDSAIDTFGGVDIVVNNASAIDLSDSASVSMKRYDLMQDVNVRGTFLLSRTCIPALRASAAAGRDPHILTLSPPIDLNPKWAKAHLAYTMAKYAMSLTTLGLAAELADAGIGVNSLWPRTTIATAAVSHILGQDQTALQSRIPDIMADAAYLVLTSPSRENTGNFYIDDDLLTHHGQNDLSRYRVGQDESALALDLFMTHTGPDPSVR